MQKAPENLAPLSGWDEYPIHQTLAPVRFVDTTDPRAFERYWFTAQARDGRFFAVIGMGFYPNLRVADAYALIVHKNRQVTVRAQRRLTVDRAEMHVGPIAASPVSPFAHWHLTLGENEQDFRFDLNWRDTKRASFRKMDFSKFPGIPDDMHLQHNWGGYETFGTIDGWIEIDGERIELAPGEAIGSRDHHWGIREGVGGSFGHKNGNFSHVGQWVEFADWAIWGDQVLYDVAAPRKFPAYSEDIDHKVAFDPVTHQFVEAIITNRLANGETRVLHFRQIPNATAYLRCAGYAGPDGRGTPDGNHHHGQDLGGAISSDVRDLSDASVRQEILGFEDHLCVVECNGETTTGIFECCNPALYKMCLAGIPGFSFLEQK